MTESTQDAGGQSWSVAEAGRLLERARARVKQEREGQRQLSGPTVPREVLDACIQTAFEFSREAAPRIVAAGGPMIESMLRLNAAVAAKEMLEQLHKRNLLRFDYSSNAPSN